MDVRAMLNELRLRMLESLWLDGVGGEDLSVGIWRVVDVNSSDCNDYGHVQFSYIVVEGCQACRLKGARSPC